MAYDIREKGITQRYTSLNEDLLREKNWVAKKYTRMQFFLAGMGIGLVFGVPGGVLAVFTVYRVMLFISGGG